MARTFDLGELWSETIAACRRDLGLYISVAAPFVLLPQLATELFTAPLPRDPRALTGAQVLVHFIVPSMIGAIAQLAIMRMASDGRETTGVALRTALTLLPALLVALLVGGVAMGLGLLALVLPGLYLWARLALAPPLIAVERLGPLQALRRSWELTDNAAWRVLMLLLLLIALSLLLAVLVGGVAAALGSVLTLIGSKALGGFVAAAVGALAATLLTVLNAVASAELYRRLR